jgi:Na+-transporting methylmalonyl-CoA/oxaloacetate decarboxylase gamma subunit
MEMMTFGLTLTVVGMGGTLLTLGLLTLVVDLLKRLFPYWEYEEEGKG